MGSDKIKYTFLSTYMKDFVKKPLNHRRAKAQKQEFEDPISEGFRQFLVLDETDLTPPNENGDKYLEKFKEKYKGIAKTHFQEPLDKDAIMKNKMTRGAVTEYQTSFCDIEKDIEFNLDKRRRKFTLPDDAEIPLTTYGIYFRDQTKALRPPLIIIPPNTLHTHGNLACSHYISEYTDHIGTFGEFILEKSIQKPQT
ncbi:uncharacterized protein LOC123005432 [Tribolium madens]|uniref:uncharacterized protein LOC123005432 n=1 Tax=Tribolium madens TaxID=41895 RepID=UPI001CF765D8|nr:uncharacterized protein LOC123005432 [Tribolium madens]